MRQFLGNQLPRFSTAETNFMKDSIDFIAVNHYSSTYAKDCIHSSCSPTATRPISGFYEGVSERDGVQIGEPVCTNYPFYPYFHTCVLDLFHCLVVLTDRHWITARSSKRLWRSDRLSKEEIQQ